MSEIKCASCNEVGELHVHHLIPRVHGGMSGPTVRLCISCHSLVHDRVFSVNHRDLTISGLAKAKARGVKLGNPNLQAGSKAMAQAAAAASSAHARQRAADVLPFIHAAQKAGASTLQQVADAMIARGIPTPGGRGRWHPATVKRVIERAAK